jgi:hypothetical protein
MSRGNFKDKSRAPLAWTSFAFAAAAGSMAAVTFVGDLTSGAFRLTGYPWVAVIPIIVAVVLMVRDIRDDSEPNHRALYSAMALPSLAASTPGTLAHLIDKLADALRTALSDRLGDILGFASPLLFTIVCATVSLLMARSVIKGGAPARGMVESRGPR